MKRKQKALKRAVIAALSLSMTVSLLSFIRTPLTVNAESEEQTKTITGLGRGTIDNPSPATMDEEWNGSYVYFGKYDEEPVRYRVLSKETQAYNGPEGIADTTMLLDCDYVLGYLPFDNDGEPNSGAANVNEWQYSDLREFLNGEGFLEKDGVFTDLERGIIAGSSIIPHPLEEGTDSGCVDIETLDEFCDYVALDGDPIFVLDVEEASNPSYGYSIGSSSQTRVKWNPFDNSDFPWFTRSASSDPSNIGFVMDNGSFAKADCTVAIGFSPALNISNSDIFSSSLISGTSNEYKLTLLDYTMDADITEGENATYLGNKIRIPYTISGDGAKNATQISVLLLKNGYFWWENLVNDENDEGLPKYTYLKADVEGDTFSTEGVATFTLPDGYSMDKLGEDFELYFLAEDVNGKYETDYATYPCNFTPEKTLHDFDYAAGTGDAANTISATCKVTDCAYSTDPITITLNAPTELTYNGSEKTASLTGYPENEIEDLEEKPDIKYYSTTEANNTSSGTALTSAPIDAGNYYAEVTWGGQTIKVPFTINKAEVTVIGITAKNKTYDGTTDVVLDYSNMTINGKVETDDVSAEATGAFDDADAKEAKDVSVTITKLTGKDAGNYELAAAGKVIQTTADITPIEAVISWSDTEFVYNEMDQLPKATVTNLINGDDCHTIVLTDGDHSEVGTYTATIDYITNSNYILPASGSKTTFKIIKADPTYMENQSFTIYCNQTLDDVPNEKGYEFSNKKANLKIGDNILYLTYTPDDTKNYNVIKNIKTTVKVLDHAWNNGETTRIPSCTSTGTRVTTCTLCGEKETEELPMLDHVPNDVVIENEKEATCTTAGSYDEVEYCADCGCELTRKTIEVAAKGHRWDDGKITTEPTATANGVKTYTCRVCKETKVEPIPATGDPSDTPKKDNEEKPKYSNEWVDGKWYDADGKQTYDGTLTWKSDATGWWVEDSAGWYPTNQWQKIDGIWYYFTPSGYMASGEYYGGYWFNGDGSWDETYYLTWKEDATGWWVEDKSGWWPSSSWLKIDGYWYYFLGSGYMATNQYVDGYWVGADGVCY